MNEEQQRKYIDQLKAQIASVEFKFAEATAEEKLSAIDEFRVLNNLLFGALEDLIAYYKVRNIRNKKQSEKIWAKRAFLNNAFQHIKTRNPDAIAALASPSVLSSKEAYWVEWAKNAWKIDDPEKLRKAVYRFAKQPEHWT